MTNDDRLRRRLRTLDRFEPSPGLLERARQSGRRAPAGSSVGRRLIVMATAFAVFGASAVLVWRAFDPMRKSGTGRSPTSSLESQPPLWVIEQATRMAKANEDPAPTSAYWVLADPATIAPAVGLTPDQAVGPRKEYLVVLHGAFTATGAKVPSGAVVPTGSVLTFTLDPDTHEVLDWGVGNDVVAIPGLQPFLLTAFSPSPSSAAPSTSASSLLGTWTALIVQDPSDPMPRLRIVDPGGSSTEIGVGLSAGWSPDCTSLVVVRPFGANGSKLVVVSPGGGPEHVIESSNGVTIEDPSWSPDGSQIAYTANYANGDPRDIQVVPAVGGTPRTLTPRTSDDFSPTWSPDGRTIAFIRVPSGIVESATELPPAQMNQVWTMHRDGSGLVRVTTMTSGAWNPHWDPGGKGIAFESGGRAYLISNVGGSGSPVSEVSLDPYSPSFQGWLPDGRLLVAIGDMDTRYLAAGPVGGSLTPITLPAATPPLVQASVCPTSG